MVDKYDLVYRSRGYDSWREMVREQDGDWVRAEDHEAELAALRAERDELRSWKAGSLEAARESETPMERYLKAQIAERDNELAALRERVAELEGKVTAIVGWLEREQPDVFRRGLWDALREVPSAGAGL